MLSQAERSGVFDEDGTLWGEQPAYFQAFYIVDRIKALAFEHPEWKENELFASLLKRDLKTALAGGEKAILELAMASHALSRQKSSTPSSTLAKDRPSPATGQPYTAMVYQPMLDLLT